MVWHLGPEGPVATGNVVSEPGLHEPFTVAGDQQRFIIMTGGNQGLSFVDPGGQVLERSFVGATSWTHTDSLITGATRNGLSATLATASGGGATEFFVGMTSDEVSSASGVYAVPGYTRHTTFADLLGEPGEEAVLATDSWLSIVGFTDATLECFAVQMSDGSMGLTAADVDGDGDHDAIALGQDGIVTIVRRSEP
jgi:hypothetical protein